MDYRNIKIDGDKIVITGGVTNGKSGNTNLIKVETVWYYCIAKGLREIPESLIYASQITY